MRSTIIAFGIIIVSFMACQASEASRRDYLELIQQYPHLVQPQGSSTKGEIEIVLEADRMRAIEKTSGRDVGVIARDRYWVWINDACIFPNGREGVYGRMLWTKTLEAAPAGVAVMPVLPDGKIVLNCNFRHATRSWEIELPRGVINPGEDPEAAARRETAEETGMIVGSLTLLGHLPPDTGMTTTVAPVFLAHVVDKTSTQQEDSEAIAEILALSLPEIEQAFLKGYYDCNVQGIVKRVAFRDPFLAYAILQYQLRKGRS